MGDPEAESVIPRIQSDLLDLFQGVAKGDIASREIVLDPRYTAAVFLVSGGYPGSYKKGMTMTGFQDVTDSILFHAGTKYSGPVDNIVTNGGRVIAVCAYGSTMEKALEQAYIDASKIQFEGKYFRSDLGFDLRSHSNLSGS
jgi:phosphoribosylamine--glycine ligase